MGRSPLDAIAYLKPDVPADDPNAAVQLPDEDAPVLRSYGMGLHCAYLWDEGDRFEYVQGRHLGAAGIDAEQLHARAVQNLGQCAKNRLQLRALGAAWAISFDGNFEASLLLVDELWDVALRPQHGGEPVIAIPARDILCFCRASSPEGVAELRAVVERVWPSGDHLLSNKLLCRRGSAWMQYGDPTRPGG